MSDEIVTFPDINDVPAVKWEKLAQKKIYFGHQSVGFNIMEGIKDVMKEHGVFALSEPEHWSFLPPCPLVFRNTD